MLQQSTIVFVSFISEMKSDYCDEAYDRVIASSVSDDELFSQIKLLGYNKDEGKKKFQLNMEIIK